MDKKDNLMISYWGMRKAIGFFALLLPFVVALGAIPYHGLRIGDSISRYYYTNMRDVFVGVLGCVGLFLISYRGHKTRYTVMYVLTGIFAILTAVFPTNKMGLKPEPVGIFLFPDNISEYIHGICALIFFVLLAVNCLWLFTRYGDSPRTKKRKARKTVYKICGGIIVAVIVLCLVFVIFFKETAVASLQPLFFLETIGLSAFGVAWLVKGIRRLHPSDDLG